MNTNIYTDSTDAYLQYQWMVSVLSDLQSDLTKEGNEEESGITISLTKKANNKSYITLSMDDKDIKVEWDGKKLTASQFNNDTGEPESIEVPDAVMAIVEIMSDEFDLTSFISGDVSRDAESAVISVSSSEDGSESGDEDGDDGDSCEVRDGDSDNGLDDQDNDENENQEED